MLTVRCTSLEKKQAGNGIIEPGGVALFENRPDVDLAILRVRAVGLIDGEVHALDVTEAIVKGRTFPVRDGLVPSPTGRPVVVPVGCPVSVKVKNPTRSHAEHARAWLLGEEAFSVAGHMDGTSVGRRAPWTYGLGLQHIREVELPARELVCQGQARAFKGSVPFDAMIEEVVVRGEVDPDLFVQSVRVVSSEFIMAMIPVLAFTEGWPLRVKAGPWASVVIIVGNMGTVDRAVTVEIKVSRIDEEDAPRA